MDLCLHEAYDLPPMAKEDLLVDLSLLPAALAELMRPHHAWYANKAEDSARRDMQEEVAWKRVLGAAPGPTPASTAAKLFAILTVDIRRHEDALQVLRLQTCELRAWLRSPASQAEESLRQKCADLDVLIEQYCTRRNGMTIHAALAIQLVPRHSFPAFIKCIEWLSAQRPWMIDSERKVNDALHLMEEHAMICAIELAR
jgi:hypothetical protein